MTLATTTHHSNLLVAGGGIGSLAAAYMLGRAGDAVTVLELFHSGKESAGFAGPTWMYDGIGLNNLLAD